MQTFDLLMSSISVQESQLSSRLTLLAFIYVPLSFVTGVFGMNLKEINGGALSAWTCVVALVVMVVLTAIFVLLLRAYEHRSKKRDFSKASMV